MTASSTDGFAPDGSVDMPVKKVTNVMFGGANLDTLYATTTAKPSLPTVARSPRGGLLLRRTMSERNPPVGRTNDDPPYLTCAEANVADYEPGRDQGTDQPRAWTSGVPANGGGAS